MDIFSVSKRSSMMARIKSKNTKPEILVRKQLHKIGLRYRIHNKALPGKPDISIIKYRTAIEVRGCFWHGHRGCKLSSWPKSNSSFWRKKIEKNIERDLKNLNDLEKRGFKVFVIWECETKKSKTVESKAKNIKQHVDRVKSRQGESKTKHL